MAKSRPKTKLMDYVNQLPDEAERQLVLQAMHDAEHVLAAASKIDEIEAQYGDGTGSVDVEAYLANELATRPARTEFESLMQAAGLLQVRLAFIEVETPEGKCFVRIDKIH